MKNDPLWHLVHALSQSEKRQLVIESDDKKQQPAYMLLYKWYVKQPTAESPSGKVLKQLKLTSATLAVQKNYLSGKITELMARNAGNSSDVMLVRNLTAQAEALFQRGLRDHAKKTLRRAFQIAEYAELFIQELELIDLIETNAITYSDFEANTQYAPRKTELLKIIENEFNCHRLSISVISLGMTMDFARSAAEKKKLKEAASDPLMYGNEKTKSLKARHHLTHARIQFYNMSQDTISMLKLCEDHFDYFDKNKESAGRDANYFIAMTYSVLSNLIQLANQNRVKDALKRWNRLPIDYKEIMTPFLTQQYNFYNAELLMRMHMLEGQPEKLMNDLPDIQALMRVDHHYQQVYINGMRFYEAMAYYSLGKYKEALKYLLDDLQDESIANRRYRFVLRSMLLRLMIHCDMQHDDVTEGLALQLERFVKKNNALTYADGLLVDFFKNWTAASSSQRKKYCTQTAEKLTARYAQQNDWQFAINNRFCIAWMVAKGNDTTLGKALITCNQQFLSS
jgi:hypothetical protein